MLSFFRNFLKSKVGVVIAIGFLVLIAFAFAGSDVANNGMFGGVSAGDKVAVVGKRKLTAEDLSAATTTAFEQARQQNPTMTLQTYLNGGGIKQAYDGLIARAAVGEFARRYGLEVGAPLIGAELAKVPAFQGLDGKFSQEAYNAVLRQRRLTDAAVQDDFAANLYARQVLTPVGLAATMPQSFVTRYASLLRERRKGAIAVLPTEIYAPAAKATDAQLAAYYQANRSRFIRPERRVLRYAKFGEEAVANLPPPTEAQIAQRYRRDAVEYAAREDRNLTQLVLPTQAAAQAIVAEVSGGKSLDAAAREKGLRTTPIVGIDQRALTTQASAAVAQAAFKAAKGAIVPPVRGALGWYVLRVDGITVKPQRTLDQVRGEITAALAAEQKAAALANLTAQIEDEFEAGTSLGEIAKKHGLTLTTTAPATADGRLYGKPATETLPVELAPVLKTAFEMDEGEPQLAEVPGGKSYIVYEAAEITPSAVAPLAEIRDDVAEAWARDEGNKAARAAADRILARVAKGAALADAVRAENPKLPPVGTLDQSREELARAGRVPPQLALFFSMAAGTTKKISAGDRGWFVVQVEKITPGALAKDDPVLEATTRQLTQVLADEYVDQFVQAMQDDVGVERNPKAVDAVRARLAGQGG